MTTLKIINIALDYTRSPAGRYRDDGPGSGEEFREIFLIPAFQNYDLVEINFDGVSGYAYSFIEEAFGGLAKEVGFEVVKKKLQIISDDDPNLEYEINQAINNFDPSYGDIITGRLSSNFACSMTLARPKPYAKLLVYDIFFNTVFILNTFFILCNGWDWDFLPKQAYAMIVQLLLTGAFFAILVRQLWK